MMRPRTEPARFVASMIEIDETPRDELFVECPWRA